MNSLFFKTLSHQALVWLCGFALQSFFIWPARAQEATEIQLPATVTDLCWGGNGRYLLLHLSELKKIEIFDVNELKITGTIPADADDTLFAAGATKAVLISGSQGIVSRWNLNPLKRELTQPLDARTPVLSLLMGCNTEGPAIASLGGPGGDAQMTQIDLDTLKLTKVEFDETQNRSRRVVSRISADGETISAWDSFVSPTGLQSYFRVGGKWMARYEHNTVGNIVPSADGRYLLTRRGVYTKELIPIANQDKLEGRTLVAAVNGPLMIGIPTRDKLSALGANAGASQSQLYLCGDSRSMASDVPVPPLESDEPINNQSLALDKRIQFAPAAKLIVLIPPKADKLVCVHYDAYAALKNSQSQHLIVTSLPASEIAAGETFNYQIEWLSSSPQVKFKLEAGPSTMTISPNGRISWKSDQSSPPINNVIVSITSNDGQEIFHTFRLNVTGVNEADAISARTNQSAQSSPAPAVESVNFGARDKEIKLPGRYGQWAVGGAGRYLLLHMPELNTIGVLDISKAQMHGYIPTGDDQTQLAATQDNVLVINSTQNSIVKWNLATLQKELTVKSPFSGPILSVAAGCASSGPALVGWERSEGPLANLGFGFLDTDTLTELRVSWPEEFRPMFIARDHPRILATSNGKTFVIGNSSFYNVLVFDKSKLTASQPFTGLTVMPSADGQYFFSSGKVMNFERATVAPDRNLGLVVPSLTGNFLLSFSSTGSTASPFMAPADDGKLYMFGSNEPLMTLPGLTMPATPPHQVTMYLPDQQLIFNQDAKVVVAANTARDAINLIKLDVDEVLEKSSINFLAVTSHPPSKLALGQSFEYTIKVAAKAGGVTCKLESGPTGMAVSTDGKVVWKVPDDWTDQHNSVIITVRDSTRKELFHKFNLEITNLSDAFARRIAQKHAEETKKRLADLRRTREQAERERQQQRVESRESNASTASSEPFPQRIWKDSSGKYTIEAAFVKVIDKKQIVLKDKSGQEKSIPVERLSAEDIYHAVECDLKRLGKLSTPVAPTNRVTERQKLASEIQTRIFQMVDLIERQDPETFIPQIYHPSVVPKMKSKSSSIVKEFLMEKLLSIDPERSEPGLETVAYPRWNIVFKKHADQWYLGD